MNRPRALLTTLLPALMLGCPQENHQPTLDPIPTQEVRVGETLRLMLTARDPDGDPLVFKATPKPITAYFEVVDGQTFFVWPPLISETGPTGRSHSVTFTVEDGGGGIAFRAVDIVVLPQMNAPIFIGPQGYILNLSEDDDISFALAVKDDDSADVTMRVIGGDCTDCPEGTECREGTCQLKGSRFQKLDPKASTFYWKPTAKQKEIGNYWRLVVGARDEVPAHGEIITEISILLMNSDAAKSCAGTPPIIFPCSDESCVPLKDLSGTGAIVFQGQGIDKESQLREMTVHYATINPLDPTSYNNNQVTMSRCEFNPEFPQLCPQEIDERPFVGTMLNPVAQASEPLFVHYFLTATDDDDIKGTKCDHTTRFPKEGHFTLAVYPNGWGGGCKDDPKEPNDVIGQPAVIDPGVTYDLRWCIGGSSTDWYKLDVEPGAILGIELLHDERHGDLAVSLHDAAGAQLYPLAGEKPAQHIGFTPQTSPVFIKVDLPPGGKAGDQTYGLMVDRTFGGCPNDEFEPNDTLDDAVLVGSNQVFTTVICPADRDWLKVSAQAGQTIELTLDFQHSFGDLDLYLYTSDGQVLARSETATSREQLVFHNGTPDTYYIEVRGYQGAVNTGELLAKVVPTNTWCFEDKFSPNHGPGNSLLLPENVYYDLLICSDKEDWYQVDMNAGETVTITVAPQLPEDSPLQVVGFNDPEGKKILGAVDASPAPNQVRWKAFMQEAGSFRWQVRTLGAETTIYAMSHFVSDPPGQCVDDRFTPSNTIKDAEDVACDVGFVTRLKICAGGEDWFRIKASAYEELFVYVFGFPDEAPLQASLHQLVPKEDEEDVFEVVEVLAGESTSNGVELIWLPEENGEFYVHVEGMPGEDHHYDLVIDCK